MTLFMKGRLKELAARNLFEAKDREVPLMDAGQRREVAGTGDRDCLIRERIRRQQRAAHLERRIAPVCDRQLDERVERAIRAGECRAAPLNAT